MRTGLDHLPSNRQRELERILEMIFEEFGDTLSLARHEWKTRGAILKIILYGSFARGDWVYEPHTRVGKHSDYDLLIVVNDSRLTDRTAYWTNLLERFRREYLIRHSILSPVQFFVHSLEQVNDALAHGRYFFIDVVRDGISLYESDDTQLSEPKPKSPPVALKMAREYYQESLFHAEGFFDNYLFSKERGRFKNAAFQIHQSVEQLYHTIMLTRTFYTPYVHDLTTLREQAELVEPRLYDAWPRETDEEIKTFGKLQQAYVSGRYPRPFEITEAQLAWLGDQARVLTSLVEQSCAERIADLEKAVAG
jgi:predicted nucleotidyltransferase/HEPN domain-containing protein